MLGLVLEGGGARGAYQIGAWKALRELGMEFNGVAGTSVGALNGAMICQDDFDKAYEIWHNMSFDKILKIDDEMIPKIKELEVFPESFFHLVKTIRELFKEGGLNVTPLRQLLSKFIYEDKIRNSGKDFGIVTVSLTGFKPLELYIEDIPKGMIVDYLMASANLPFFKLEKIDGKLYIDGGFFDNLPIKLLTAKGYKDIIAIRLYGIGRTRRINKNRLNLITINPSEDLGGTLDFSAERAQRNLKLGYYDALSTIKKYSGRYYYIIANQPDDYFLQFFLNLSQEGVQKLAKILGFPDNIPYRRLLFEKIIPRLSDILGLVQSTSYKDIFISLVEKAALYCKIDKFRIYDFDELLNLVLQNYHITSETISDKIPRIFKQSEIVIKSVKEQLFPEIVSVFVSELKK
ncbi:MAG TPA: patatin-like phospholipase family protein [Thermoanaerobacterales bacterium]|uniref:patatin-like phospholipase family protein n=1 Tax=Tepidanaerobacter sp. GT38 TaxID=2722793 RepID=UPI001852B4C0|nr:patatin-like phospholipase family protein [Tepidanaerobacter sp. GT38]MCG1012221.1 patatin-like phospholipase family protein [Tepidanaerobacter sp. GT38]HHY42600.1 patatin-like phospholipase family protein [Thermoanaerobacterales bacterium]